MRKRILSATLALVMILTLLPSMAFATDGTAITADSAQLSSGSYVLNEDVTLAGSALTIPAGATVTIDLNGHKLTNAAGQHTIVNNGTLTITDSTADKAGTVDNVSHGRGAVYNNAGATCTILAGNYTRSLENGSSDSDNGGNSWYVIKNFGTMTIGQQGGKDSDIHISFTSAYSSLVANGWQNGAAAGSGSEPAHTADARLTIYRGTFQTGINTIKNDDYGVLTIAGGIFSNVAQYAVMNWNKAAISGGTFQSDSWAVVNCGDKSQPMDVGELTVTGGTFTGAQGSVGKTETADAPRISGGNFSSDVSAFVTADAMISAGSDGRYTVKLLDETSAAASVTTTEGVTTYYKTLNEAVAAADNGATVKLLRDVDNATGMSVAGGKTFTLDFGGHTYTLTGPGAGSTATETNGFQLLKGSTITMKNGTIRIAENANNVKRVIQNYADLTLEDLHIYAANQVGGEDYCLSFNNGTITFKGDTDVITTSDSAIAFDVYYWASYYPDGVSVTFDESYTGTVNGKIVYDSTDAAKASLTINGRGHFGAVTTSSSTTTASIVISGGYFNADPSAYLASGKAALASDLAGYTFQVTDAGKTPAAVAQGTVQVAEVPASITGADKTLADSVKEALTSGTPTLSGTGMDLAMNTAANANTVTAADESVKSALADAKVSTDGKTVTIAVQPYLDVAITAANAKTGSLTLDITPMVRTVATTADLSKGETIQLSGSGVNGAVVGKAQTLTINKAVTVSLPLPQTVADGALYVTHVKDGRTYIYTGTVKDHVLTFTNPHGFSAFTLSATNSAVASIGDVGYAYLQDAVDAVTDGQTITLLADNLSAYVNHAVTFTVAENGHTGLTLTAGSGYTLAKDGNTYTCTGTGISSATTYSVSIAKTENGTVKSSSTRAARGHKVTLTVTASKGYELDTLTVKDRSGNTIKLTNQSSGKYTFSMPGSNVTVTAKFKAADEAADSLPFTDVSGHWGKEAITYVYEKGLMNGVSDTKFSPDATLSRAMLVTILYRMEKEPVVNYQMTFTDVPSGAWYTEAVRWAASEKIVTGYSDTAFGPDRNITREQLAAILYRYAQYKGYDTTQGGMAIREFDDYASISSYATTPMTWAVNAGLISGVGNDRLNPAGTATRAQAAQLLMNFSEKVAK